MRTLPLIYAAKHMFVDLPEGRWLVDTGNPTTFGAPGVITWNGVERKVPTSLGPLTISDIATHVEMNFVGLLGADLINAQDTCWDGPSGEFRLHDARVSADAVAIDYTELLGAPILHASIGGHRARCIFDTGAQFGYILHDRFAEGGIPDAHIDDFSPLLGAINCPSWRVQADVNGVRFTERVGRLDGLAGFTLSAFGIDAIIGCSWLPSRRVWCQPSARKLFVSPAV